MRLETKIGLKRVTIHDNGDVYVNGEYTNLRQWSSNPKFWSNGSGQQINDLKNKSLEEVLKIRGYIGPEQDENPMETYGCLTLAKHGPLQGDPIFNAESILTSSRATPREEEVMQ